MNAVFLQRKKYMMEAQPVILAAVYPFCKPLKYANLFAHRN